MANLKKGFFEEIKIWPQILVFDSVASFGLNFLKKGFLKHLFPFSFFLLRKCAYFLRLNVV